MPDVTRQLARYASSLTYEDLTDEVREKAKHLLLDLLGNALRAAADAESTPSIRAAVSRFAAPGRSSVIGQAKTLGAGDAAFMNGSLAHSLDFDDTHREGSVHPGASTIPLALAVAEQNRINGRRFLAAMVVGYDVTCRLAVALGAKSHYDRGFHPTATAGVFGATAAGGNLLGLDAATIGHAFGVNGSQAAGSMQFFDNGAWNKRIHPGLAARSAALALDLAMDGFVGATRPIEGAYGFLHGYSDSADAAKATSRLGRRFEIMTTAIKPYPACRYAHAPLDSIIELATKHNLRPEEIDSVRIGLSDAGLDLIGRPLDRKRDPKNVVDCQFSMPFTAAVALSRRRLTWDDYDLLKDPGVRRLARKVDVFADPNANRVFPKQWLASVELGARGTTFRDQRWRTRGEPEDPLTWDDVVSKFNGLARVALSDRRRARVVELVRRLETVPDMRELGSLVRTGPVKRRDRLQASTDPARVA